MRIRTFGLFLFLLLPGAELGIVGCRQVAAPPASLQTTEQQRENWLAADRDMRRFLSLPWAWLPMGEPQESLEQLMRRNPSPEAPYTAALLLQQMSRAEKEQLALRYCAEFETSLRRLGLHPESDDFATEFIEAAYSRRAVQAAHEDMWDWMADWDGVWQRTTSALPPEQSRVLATRGGERVMDFYASYLLARYVALNEHCDARTRSIARSVISLFDIHSDGEYGYRGTYSWPASVYTPMRPDPQREQRAYQKKTRLSRPDAQGDRA